MNFLPQGPHSCRKTLVLTCSGKGTVPDLAADTGGAAFALTPWEKLKYFGKGIVNGGVNLVWDLPKYVVNGPQRNINRLRTMPLPDVLAAI